MSGALGVWGAAVAVVGTLAGVALTSNMQGRRDRAARRETRRGEALAAATQFMAALAAHRGAMWKSEDARLAGQPPERVAELRAARHETRNAIEMPLHTVAILMRELTGQAEDATRAVYAMRDATDRADLDTRREAAIAAHGQFVAATRTAFDNWDTRRRRRRLV